MTLIIAAATLVTVTVLAARFDTRRLLTFDHRHFRAMRPGQGGSFELPPER